MMRICTICKIEKPLSEFYSRGGRRVKEYHGPCRACWSVRSTEHYHKNHDRLIGHKREQRARVKKIVLEHYGAKCTCCGETEKSFLEYDHINNDGAAHRKSINNPTGANFFVWLFRNGFPDFIQLLCANCHRSKTRYGFCVHTLEWCT
jgi:hypothetical protein